MISFRGLFAHRGKNLGRWQIKSDQRSEEIEAIDIDFPAIRITSIFGDL
jgi:hypothetical protein